MKTFSKTGLQNIIQDVYVGGLDSRTTEELETAATQLRAIADTLMAAADTRRRNTLEIVVNSGSFSVFIDGFFCKNLETWPETLRYCGTMGMRRVRVHTWQRSEQLRRLHA